MWVKIAPPMCTCMIVILAKINVTVSPYKHVAFMYLEHSSERFSCSFKVVLSSPSFLFPGEGHFMLVMDVLSPYPVKPSKAN